jgi:DNA-binding GntR family transcriptional regulator
VKNIKEQIYDSILEDLIDGVYPIDFVFNEKFLIDKYQVSRSPIRDALVALCNEKILRSIPRYGYEIVRITEQNMRDIAQLRAFIEVQSFKLCCEAYCDEMLERIVRQNEQNVRQMRTEEPNLRTMWRNNINFHTMLLSFAGNQYSVEVLERALTMQYRAYPQLYRRKNLLSQRTHTFESDINEYHDRLADCLRARDFKAAAKVLRDDIYDIPVYIRDE